MDKVRITEVASEVAKKPKEVLEACKVLGIEAKAAQSSIVLQDAQRIMEFLINGVTSVEQKPKPPAKPKQSVDNKPKVESAPKKEDKPKRRRRKALPEKEKSQKQEETSDKNQKDSTEKRMPPIPRKRTGLRIIKKKRPVQEKVETKKSEIPSAALYGKKKVALSSEEEKEKKKKNKKQLSPTTKKDSGIKIDVLSDRELSNDFYDSNENEVVLPDLTVTLMREKAEEQEAKRKEQQKRTVASKNGQHFQQQTISRGGRKRRKRPEKIKEDVSVSVVEIPEEVRVYEFAEAVNKPIGEVIKALFTFGMMVTKNDFLDKDAIEVLAEEFEVEIKTKNIYEELDYVGDYNNQTDHLEQQERPPIITIMGHVDHGKTSLLDYIRNTKIADGEAGGITQHVGAYTITKNEKEITFIDTPGHEAFTQMRARGAGVTDIVVIVVAADDGVMPQTKEAINHAKAAEVPMIIAINKMDRPNANPDLIKGQLAELNITSTDWGGEYEFIGVSAKTGEGIDDLLETILLQSELMELKATTDMQAKAVVIESSLEKGRGPVATVIVGNGTLKKGDNVIAGTSFGRIRAITDDMGKIINELKPSHAGQILGLDSVPKAGDTLVVMKNEKQSREKALKLRELDRQKELSKSTKATLDDLHDLIAEGKLNKLPIVVKADVQGTLEALNSSLSKLRNEEVKVDIIHSAVGAISESDVVLAGASEHTVIVGFHVKPTPSVKQKAKELGVEIKTYDIIYDLLEARDASGGRYHHR